MIDRDYIETVLARFEGKAIARGYIPCQHGTYYGTGPEKGEPLGASGVTIATGVDLGQQTVPGLRSMGVSEHTLAILTPYIGLQREHAMKKLQSSPFQLTEAEVEEIDRAVHKRYIDSAAALFGREAFENAPKEAQAVAVSLHYQFGTPRRQDSPALEKAWESMKRGEYRDAAAYLRSIELWSKPHRAYMARRFAEAAILDKA
jgi:GH24 family phage-related lysozyme (muramidase)